MNILLVELCGNRPEFNEPLGLGCLSSALTRDKRLVITDMSFHWNLEHGPYPPSDKIREAHIIGVSIQIRAFPNFRELYEHIRKINSKALIVVGNVVPTFGYEQILQEFPEVVCVRSEGELAICELAFIHQSRQIAPNALHQVAGIAFQNGDSAQVNPIKLSNLKEYSHPDRPFLSFIREKGGIARIEGSRGCHWGRCEFCSVAERFGFSNWRQFEVAHIVEELRILSSNGIRSPYFTDEDFFGRNYERAISLAHAIIAAKKLGEIHADMNFFISSLAADIKDDRGYEAVRHLRAAGLREVFVGIESGVKDQLKRFQKKATADTNTLALERLSAIGLQVDIGYIMFDPFTKFEDLSIHIDYLRKLTLDGCHSRVIKGLRIQPGLPPVNEDA
ncbi:MAG: cobalamin-dependent protein [Fimbriimonas sp.]|nr:cobalamin-dependent protein [Fimbriimonas sp.]